MAFSGDEAQIVAELCELLDQPAAGPAALEPALSYLVGVAGRTAGAIVLPGPDGTAGDLVLSQPLPPEWPPALADAASPLGHAARRLLAGETVDPSLDLDLAAAVPLRAGLQVVGALLVHGAPCTPATLEWLAYLGQWVAQALRLREPAASPAQSRTALHQIATALTSTLQLDEILTSTVDGIRELFQVEAAALVLRDEARGELIFKKALGSEPDWILQYSLQVDRGLIGECLAEGRPVRVNQAALDPRFDPQLDGVSGYATRAVLCAPLVARGQVLGALQLINKLSGDFSEADQEQLVSLAASVANALYNARLVHQLTVANAELEASRWEIMQSRRTLQALFDGITSPIYIVDSDYNLVAANATCAQAVGEAPETLVGRRCYEVLRHTPDACSGCRLAQVWSTGQAGQRTERRWPVEAADRADGPSEWEINTYPIRNEQGQVIQAIVLSQDVTEKRRLEASLAQSEKLAAVGQLAAGVAHEINNPLAAIIANAQLLQRELPPEDDRRESVDLIALAGDRAQRVVRGLLDLARQDGYSAEPTDVNASVQGALALVEGQFRPHNIELVRELAPDLPPLMASNDHLQGVWLNLILNARDALSGQPGEIRVTTRLSGQEVLVTVADTGAGIPVERLPRIFEPFFTTKAPGRGTGLGLSVCHRIVKQHGGFIKVSSTPGQGTAFTVVLPVVSAAVV
jgi:two-component system NtrC family sensor kinase